MLTLEVLGADLPRLPVLARVGLAGLVLALFADVVAHLEVSVADSHVDHVHGFTGSEAAAHVGFLVSMVVILLGVVLDGVRRSRARSAARNPRKGVA